MKILESMCRFEGLRVRYRMVPVLRLACLGLFTCILPCFPAQVLTNDLQYPPPEVVTVRAVDPYASEPGVTAVIDPGKFVISRTYYTNIEQHVFFRLGGTAVGGVDYVMPHTNQVVIPVGRSSVEVPVRSLFDNLPEPAESIVLRIEPPVCIAVFPPPITCYRVGQPGEAVVFIRDFSPTNRPPRVSILEPTEGQVFNSPAKVFIRAITVDAEGYCWKAEFFDGLTKLGEVTREFLVAPTNGTPIPFQYSWTDAPAGRHALSVRATSSRGDTGVSMPVQIVMEPASWSQARVSVTASQPIAIQGTNCWGWWNVTNRYPTGSIEYQGSMAGYSQPIWWHTNCGPKNGAFTIRRVGATNEDLHVFFRVRGSATNGVDYESLPSSVIIAAGERKVDVPIVPKEDSVFGPKTVILELQPPPYLNPLPSPYVIVPPARAGIVIVDSSRPFLPIGPLQDRSFYIGGTALDGAWYRLERSTNLRDWEILCTNEVVQGQLHFLDPDAENASAGFYRATPVAGPAE